MDLTTMTYQLDEDGIAIITIDVKDRSMNILTPEFHGEVGLVVEHLTRDDKAVGAVIRSGKSAFLAGGDIKRIVGLYELNRSPEQAYKQSSVFSEALRKLETCGKPVACAINGAALGGGLELALACHYRVVSDDPKIPLGLPETRVGLIPGAGGTQRLPRLIGIKEAAELILTGKHISPQKALELGMADQLVDKEHLLAEARRWVLEEGKSEQVWDRRGFLIPGGSTLNNPKIAKICQDLTTRVAVESRYNYPAPIAALKTIINGTTVSSFDAALKIESREFSKLTRDAIPRNMMRSLFLHKGLLDTLHKRPAEFDKFKVKQLAIVDHASSDKSFAFTCAISGIQVTLLVESESKNGHLALNYAREQLTQRINSGKTTREKADSILANINISTDKDILNKVEVIVINTASDIKLLPNIDDAALVVINVGQTPLGEVIAISAFPERVVGWSLEQPADLAQAVEIVTHENTNDETLARILDLSEQIRKTPLLQSVDAELFSKACVSSYLEEGLHMLNEGISPALIENAARDSGMPKGPLELIDELSLSYVYQSMNGNSVAKNILHGMLEKHERPGFNEGKGFYDYATDNTRKIWPQLATLFNAQASNVDLEVLNQRFLSIQSLKATSYWENNCIDIIDADVASLLIWGFPSYSGGVFSYIDTLGLSTFIKQCEQLVLSYGERFKVSDWLYEKCKENDRIYSVAA